MAEPCHVPFTVPVSDDNRGVSGKDASFLGDINNASDRANQDRYLAGEFRGLGVAAAERNAALNKDRADDARWSASQTADSVAASKAVELAVEKTAAATILAIEKTAAAAALAAAECCCELRTAIAVDGEKTRGLISQIDRERLQARLAVLEARSGV